MSRNRMETVGIQFDKHHPTGRVKIHFDKGVHHFDILPLQAYDFIHPAVVRMAALSANPALVYFGTLAQRSPHSERALKALLRSTNATRFLDINLRAPWYEEKTLLQSLQYANIVKLNAEELDILASMFKLPGETPEKQVKDLMHRFALEQVMVTCGESGAWQVNQQGRKIEIDVKHQDINLIDTVGAGDGFAAICIVGALQRWPMAKTLERANEFAASICGIRGAIPDHADFYEPFKKEWHV